ncbi:MAG: TonB-dependent receptor [Bacteroidota bacterium]
MKIIIPLAILVTLATLAPFASAQEALRNINLEKVVISANKVEESKDKISQAMEMITPIQIRQINAATTADLISNNGSLSVQKSQQGGGSPVIRGFEASRIVLVVDGIRMNNLIYRAGHLQNIITIDPAALEKVEILYGPSSTMYGSDALGGVINLITKSPKLCTQEDVLELTGEARLSYSSAASEKDAHMAFNIATTKVASYTSVSYSDFGDLMMGKAKNPFHKEPFGERPYYVQRFNNKDSLVKSNNRFLQKFSGYSQTDVIEKLLIKSGTKSTHSLNFQVSNSTDVPRYDRLTDPAGNGLKYAEWYYGPQNRLLFAYDYNLSKTFGLDNIHAGANFQKVKESRYSRKFGNNRLDGRIENVNVFGINLDGLKSWSKNEIRFGLDVQRNGLKSTALARDIVTNAESPLDTRYPDGENTMNTSAVYYSHRINLNEQWTFNDGIRLGYSKLHSTFVDTTFFRFPFKEVTQKNMISSASVGLVFLPNKRFRSSVNISSGFRVPNVDDLSKIFESAPGTLIVPNPNLKPERSYNFDLGVDYKFSEYIKWENVMYFTYFRNAIVTDDYKYNGQDSILYEGEMSKVVANQNKEKALITGISSTLLAEPLPWYYGVTITYTYGMVIDNESPLDHIPPLYGKLYLGYRKGKWDAQFFSLFNGTKRIFDYRLGAEDNEAYATPEGTPAWLTLNLRCSYDLRKNLIIQAGLDNLMDIQYRTFSSGINAPGRNFMLTLRGTF